MKEERSSARARKLPNLVVVPPRPAALILPPTAGDRPRDEVDLELDELFGPPVQLKPGPLDVVLSAGGVAAIGYAVLAGGGGTLLLVGAVLLMLGMALPVRSAWRRLQRGRSARRLAGTLRQGDPLNLTSSITRRLAVDYERVERLAATDQVSGSEALEASWQALQEVAGLLKGRPPQGAAEPEYVARRASAVDGLARMLESSRPADGAGTGEESVRDAAVEAISGFEQRSGMSSVDRIES